MDSLLADIEDTKWDIGFAQTQTAVAGAPKESLLVLLGDYLGVLEGAVAAATNGSWGNGTVAHPAAPGNVIVLSETSAAARMAFGRAGLLAGVVAGLLGAVVLL